MAATRGPADVRGARAPGADLRRAVQRRRPAPHRRRADRASPPAGARLASWRRCACPPPPTARWPAASPTSRSRPTAPRSASSPTSCATAGLDRVNFSLDSLRRDRFLAITRRDDLDKVLDGIDAAQEAGFDPGEGQLRRGAWRERRRDRRPRRVRVATPGSSVRFIEFMPLDASGAWGRRQGRRPGRDRGRHRRRLPARAAAEPGCGAGRPLALPRRPRRRRRHPHRHQAVLRRLRPRADHGRRPVPHLPVRHHRVRPAPASSATGGSDDDLAAEITRAVGTKWAGHAIGQVQFIRPNRSMSQIGG